MNAQQQKTIATAKTSIELVVGELQDQYDNLGENAQSSDKGYNLQMEIDGLQSAVGSINEVEAIQP